MNICEITEERKQDFVKLTGTENKQPNICKVSWLCSALTFYKDLKEGYINNYLLQD